MGISVEEQETVINFSRNSDKCSIWTSDSTMITRLDKLVESEPDWKVIETGTIDGQVVSKIYETTKSLISFRGHKVTREMTDEQRMAAAERLKASREKRKEGNNG